MNISAIKEKYLSSGTFAANTITLMIGTSIAQAIPIVLSPIMTRLYSPNDYGLFALFFSIVSILAVIATGQYEMTIMLPAKDSDAMDIVVLTLIIVVSVSFLLLLSIVLFKEQLTVLINNQEFSTWIYFIPLFVFLAAAYQPMNYWLNRKKLYCVMSSRSIIQTVSASLIQLSLGFSGLTRIGLFAGAFTGQGVSLGLVGWQMWRDEKKDIREVQYKKIKAKAKEYKDFPFYSAPTSLLDVASLQAPIFFIVYAFGTFQVGLFSLTLRVLALPAIFIGTAIGQVYHQRIAKMRHDSPEELTNFILRSAKYLALIVAFPVLILGLAGPNLFSFVFGEQWRNAGIFAQVLAVAIGFRFVISPLSTIMPVSGNIKLGAKWKTIYFCTTYITLFIATNFSIVTFMIIYSIHEVVLYFLYFYFIVRASKQLR